MQEGCNGHKLTMHITACSAMYGAMVTSKQLRICFATNMPGTAPAGLVRNLEAQQGARVAAHGKGLSPSQSGSTTYGKGLFPSQSGSTTYGKGLFPSSCALR